MAQISGNSVIFQIGKETTFGTVAPATDRIRISSESFRPTYNKVSEGLATGGKGAGKVQTMGIQAGGSFSTLMRPDMGLLLELLCGVKTGNVYTPIGTELTDSLPSFTAYVDRKAAKCSYPGSKINQITFSAAAGEYLNISVDCTSKLEATGATIDSLTPSEEKAFRFASGKVKINDSVIADVTSMELTYNNNLAADTQTTDTGDYFKEPECGVREITGTMEMIYAAGAETLRSTLYKTDATFSIEYVFESDDSTLTFSIPCAQMNDASANMGSPSEMLRQSMSWNACENGTDELIEITLE